MVSKLTQGYIAQKTPALTTLHRKSNECIPLQSETVKEKMDCIFYMVFDYSNILSDEYK